MPTDLLRRLGASVLRLRAAATTEPVQLGPDLWTWQAAGHARDTATEPPHPGPNPADAPAPADAVHLPTVLHHPAGDGPAVRLHRPQRGRYRGIHRPGARRRPVPVAHLDAVTESFAAELAAMAAARDADNAAARTLADHRERLAGIAEEYQLDLSKDDHRRAAEDVLWLRDSVAERFTHSRGRWAANVAPKVDRLAPGWQTQPRVEVQSWAGVHRLVEQDTPLGSRTGELTVDGIAELLADGAAA